MKKPKKIKITNRTTEVRYRHREPDKVDEVVSGEVDFFHLEQMDDGHWWLGLDLKNGPRLTITFWTKRNAEINVRVETDG